MGANTVSPGTCPRYLQRSPTTGRECNRTSWARWSALPIFNEARQAAGNAGADPRPTAPDVVPSTKPSNQPGMQPARVHAAGDGQQPSTKPGNQPGTWGLIVMRLIAGYNLQRSPASSRECRTERSGFHERMPCFNRARQAAGNAAPDVVVLIGALDPSTKPGKQPGMQSGVGRRRALRKLPSTKPGEQPGMRGCCRPTLPTRR